MIERPYFLNNPEWYTFNAEEWRYELTDKAPAKARESYAEFYNNTATINGEEFIIDK